MDYVLFGMGYGASLMLLGWALRTFGPRLKYSEPPQEDDANFSVEQRFWVRFVQGLGGVIAIAGTTVVLMTFVVVLVNPDDDTGGTIALAIWAFILLAIVLWCWMYVRHYGLTGVWSRQNGYGFRASTRPAPVHPSPGRAAVRDVRPRKQLDRDAEVAVPAPEWIEPDAESLDDVPAGETVLTDAESPEADPEIAQTEPEIGPVYDFGDISDTTVPSDVGGRAEALRRLRERQARARQSST